MTMQMLRLFIRLSRPIFLLGAALLYALGAGIARYLGVSIDWELYFLGQVWITILQLSTHYLNEYFDAPFDVENPNRTPFSGGSGALGQGKLPRPTAFWAGIACLSVVASFSVILIRRGGHSPAVVLTMVLIFLGAFFYSVPPVRLVSSGYGELITSVVVANLVPAFAFLLQNGEFHRILAMATFPLTAFHLAMMLAFELPDYAVDYKYEKRTLLVRMGWQRGMLLHNILVLSGFLLFGLAAVFGMPLAIALPPYLLLPLGLFQIWLMNRIADGAKPNWTILTLTALALFGIAAYLHAFSFWTR